MNISQFNYVESGLWLVVGLLLTFRLVKEGISNRYFKVLFISAVTFFIFSISDLVEASTGAWWRPWWLLLIKAGCVASLAVCFLCYKRISASGV